MPKKYTVRTVVFSSGERFPMLLDYATGLPLFEPTLFAIATIRAANRASATIDQVLRAVSVLYHFLDVHSIDLQRRTGAGELLQLDEIDGLARYCRLPFEAISQDDSHRSAAGAKGITKVQCLEKARMSPKAHMPEVDAQSASIRLRYIRDYLVWLTWDYSKRVPHSGPVYSTLKSNAEAVKNAITARLPSAGGRNSVGQREGMAPEAFEHLLEVIDPDSPDNPWTSKHARQRNALAVLWLITVGVRRGELLGIRISDIDFRKCEVFIARRADDVDDPREKQPLVKTHDRIIPVDGALLQHTHHYIAGARRALPGARRHDFLFVANGTGAPMSLDALNKAFVTLRKKCPTLPNDLTPHVLRHTWNDRFSEHMDAAQVSEEQEKKMRSYLMGWSETSGTATTYTRRHVREKAKKASLELQANLLKGDGHGK